MGELQQLPRRLPAYPTELADVAEPFTAHVNAEHPSPDGGDDSCRLVVTRTSQMWLHAASDSHDHVPLAAVYWEGLGENIELGPWSMSLVEALELAENLKRMVARTRKLLHANCNCAELLAADPELRSTTGHL